MPITVSERTHWKERIGKRIDQHIERLVAKQDPTLLEKVTKEARERAYESLGIGAQQQELDAIQKQREELERREKRLHAEQRAVLSGKTVDEELERGGYYRYDSEVENAVKARAKALEADILAESDLGKQVLREMRAVVDHVLESRGEVDLEGTHLREPVEQLVGQCGRAVLYRAAQAVLLARHP
jgi:hypothetical protein